MSQKGYTSNPPKYMNDFSKALAGEVRILLAEVGKLRDERRQLQYEIAELMALKSKHGAGGEYVPDWRPSSAEPHPPALPPPPPAEPEGPLEPARPAWRTVNKRADRRGKSLAKIAAPPPPPSPSMIPPLEPPRPNVPAWAQWRPNPLHSPAPVMATPGSPLPSSPASRSGLFGPPSPTSK